MPAFKDEHVLVVAPGSTITQVQLGLPETFTPPRWRFPTRMFPGLKEGEWEPVLVRERVKLRQLPKQDVEMKDTTADAESTPALNGTTNGDTGTESAPDAIVSTVEQPEPQAAAQEEDETEYYDDPFTIANAVYPIKSGRVEDWPCFFALLTHIYNMISPPFHMPVLVVAQPCWTARDKEIITQYLFESWKIPALCVVDAAVSATWGMSAPSATVIDVGYEKADISCVYDFTLQDLGRAVAVEGCGGRALTQRLKEELIKNKDKYAGIEDLEDLAEQIKRSAACEILPSSVPLPGESIPAEQVMNPLVAASTAPESAMSNVAPPATVNGKDDEDNEGVLDVASIVAQTNAAEIIAKREREKAEKDAKKKGAVTEQPKQIKLRNSERVRTTFTYEETIPLSANATSDGADVKSRKRKREVEVGLERFMTATPSAKHMDSVLDRLAAAIHSTIMSVPEMSYRSTLWEHLIIVGNGSKIRGFTAALLENLSSRYTLSPSNATIFTSELPSNFSTPVPTGGTNTPIPGQHPPQHQGVNPLLVAATKNMMQPMGAHLQVPGQPQTQPHQMHGYGIPQEHMQQHTYRGFTQTPQTMKTVKPPEYFPEWKDPSVAGFEDATFLGAQMVAKIVFIVDGGQTKGFLTRSEYNELGPEGIHSCSM